MVGLVQRPGDLGVETADRQPDGIPVHLQPAALDLLAQHRPDLLAATGVDQREAPGHLEDRGPWRPGRGHVEQFDHVTDPALVPRPDEHLTRPRQLGVHPVAGAAHGQCLVGEAGRTVVLPSRERLLGLEEVGEGVVGRLTDHGRHLADAGQPLAGLTDLTGLRQVGGQVEQRVQEQCGLVRPLGRRQRQPVGLQPLLQRVDPPDRHAHREVGGGHQGVMTLPLGQRERALG